MDKIIDRITEYSKKSWDFLKKDTLLSFIVTIIIAFLVIKYVFFPILALLTGSSLPLVIVESCSMYHQERGFEKILDNSIYLSNGITLSNTGNWDFQNGLSKGDVIFLVRPNNIEKGDVIVFNAGSAHPLIHRVIRIGDTTYGTKGDNYITNSNQLPSEKKITEDQLVGKALFKIPAIGWVKLEANRIFGPFINKFFPNLISIPPGGGLCG